MKEQAMGSVPTIEKVQVLSDWSDINDRYIAQVDIARMDLEGGGFKALAVLGPEGSNSHALATDIGLEPVFYDDFPSVLRASHLDGDIASVLPLQARGDEKCVPFQAGSPLSNLGAIGESRSRLIE
jgi:hypothetical protein